MNDKPHLDVEALAELQDVMEDEFDVLIQTYLADSRSRIDGLKEALATADPEHFAKTAHSFKGSCGNMGALALQQACEEAERAGSTANPQAAQASYEKVQHSFERIVPLLGL